MARTTMNEALAIDRLGEIEHITRTLREQTLGNLHKRGAVLGISGGIDSAVCAALAVRAFGPDRVLGIFMPERHSDEESLRLGRMLASQLGIDTALEDIGPGLDGMACYERQIEAIRSVIPDYGPGWKCKLTLPSILEGERLNVFQLVVESPAGERRTARMHHGAYLALVAATNMKQRLRKTIEYTHADRLNYAVVGTPNRLEYDQGFFVKQGDGAADVKPIAHLYKTQVYALADELGIPDEIRKRPPTTDTWSLAQTQEEFFFSLPLATLDRCLWAHDHDLAPPDVAPHVGLTESQVERVFKDIDSKRRATRALHQPPLVAREVPSVSLGMHASHGVGNGR